MHAQQQKTSNTVDELNTKKNIKLNTKKVFLIYKHSGKIKEKKYILEFFFILGELYLHFC